MSSPEFWWAALLGGALLPLVLLYLAVFFFWPGGAIVVATAVRARGRNALTWFLAGLFFTPIAEVLFLMVFPILEVDTQPQATVPQAAIPPTSQSPMPAIGMRKHCRWCGALNPTASDTCTNCGRLYP